MRGSSPSSRCAPAHGRAFTATARSPWPSGSYLRPPGPDSGAQLAQVHGVQRTSVSVLRRHAKGAAERRVAIRRECGKLDQAQPPRRLHPPPQRPLVHLHWHHTLRIRREDRGRQVPERFSHHRYNNRRGPPAKSHGCAAALRVPLVGMYTNEIAVIGGNTKKAVVGDVHIFEVGTETWPDSRGNLSKQNRVYHRTLPRRCSLCIHCVPRASTGKESPTEFRIFGTRKARVDRRPPDCHEFDTDPDLATRTERFFKGCDSLRDGRFWRTERLFSNDDFLSNAIFS
jgi:hypothetical protein